MTYLPISENLKHIIAAFKSAVMCHAIITLFEDKENAKRKRALDGSSITYLALSGNLKHIIVAFYNIVPCYCNIVLKTRKCKNIQSLLNFRSSS